MSVKYQKIYGIKSNSQSTSITIEPENSDPALKDIIKTSNQLTTRKEDKGEEKRKNRGIFTQAWNTSSDSNLEN